MCDLSYSGDFTFIIDSPSLNNADLASLIAFSYYYYNYSSGRTH